MLVKHMLLYIGDKHRTLLFWTTIQ